MKLSEQFLEFTKLLMVDTKEQGVRPLFPLLGTQRYFLERMWEAYERGIRTFVVLKGRQAGLSTISNALDVFWTHRFPGTQATLVTDNERNREGFRTTITQFVESLPYERRIRVSSHNRTHLVLANRSRLIYQVAGTRLTGNLGRGSAINYLHATECSSWQDEEGLASLMASLAEKNPRRLYLFESTAKGHNMWEDIWEQAQKAVTQEAIFIGWWRHDFYRCAPDSNEYRTYWETQPRLTASEREWVHQIKRAYDFDMAPEQIAWWRYQLYEKFHEDETLLIQEHPPLPEMAFVMTGSQFFAPRVLNDLYSVARGRKFRPARYHFGEQFESTTLLDCMPRHAELKVWEAPVPGAAYVIGADPAYGSSENADRFAIQVFRCFADQLEQVAEYCTPDISTYQFAWAIMALAGAYRNAYFILEINGPGGAVYDEMKNVKRLAYSGRRMWEGREAERDALRDAVGSIRNYVWAKPDSALPGANTLHWKTNLDNKQFAMNLLRDYVTRAVLKVNSEELIREMRKIVREEGGDIKGDGRSKDDLTMAAALACVMWTQRLRPILTAQGATRGNVEKQQNVAHTGPAPVPQLAVVNYLKQAGIVRRGRRA